jgi:hypothetical protein
MMQLENISNHILAQGSQYGTIPSSPASLRMSLLPQIGQN